MQITVFRNIYELTTPYYIDVYEVLNRIKSGNIKDLIQKIRSEKNKKERNELKKKLPSILFSGTFPNRKSDAIPLEHSGLIVLDIDEPENIKETHKAIIEDPFTFSCFVSPSGNGFKVLVKIPPDTDRHRAYFLGLENYYNSKLKIQVDASGKNINRVCYESYDPDIYINKDSQVFKQLIEDIPQTTSKNLNTPIVPASQDKVIQHVTTWWQKNYNFHDGRNQSIYQLAAAFNRFGVDYVSALNHCLQYVDHSKPNDPFNENEITGVVKKVYDKLSHMHGTEVFEDSVKTKDLIDNVMSHAIDEAVDYMQTIPEFIDHTPIELQEKAEKIRNKSKSKDLRIFWYYDDGKLKIDIEAMIRFGNDNGYYVYYPNKKPDSYIYIKIENNIIKKVDIRHIKKCLLDFVLKHQNNIVYNLLNDRPKYWTANFWNALPDIDPPILRDSKYISYIPTKTAVFKIDKKGVKKIDYVDLTEGYVWETQITEKDFDYVNETQNFPFLKFINLVAGEGREDSMRSILGYLLHTFKNPSFSRAVFFYDKNVTQFDGDPEGGSGKSLLIEGLKYIREIAPIPGDRIDFNRSFVFQEIMESTQVAWIDELEKGFDMQKFFSRITNGLPVEQKRKDVVFIDNNKAPKFVFTSNYKPKGISGSHRRRRIDFGVTDYFNIKHTPIDEFDETFFTDWDKDKWDQFFSVYVDCLVLYLKNGVIETTDNQDEYITLISETNKDFAEYMILDGALDRLLYEGMVYGRELWRSFISEKDLDESNFSIKKFYNYIKKTLNLYNVKHKFDGKGESKVIYFYND